MSARTTATTEPLVTVRGLTVTFDGAARPAVDGLDLMIHRGEIVAIVGESGSGKSVTARTLVGLAGDAAHVQAEELTIDGADARRLSDRGWRRIRGTSVGLVLQDALVSLDPLRRVGAEVGESLRRTLPGLLARGRRRARAIELLAQVGIPDPADRVDSYPHELSGGLRQRALIASALASQPALLVADEPTTALDVTVQAQILELLAQLRSDGTALLLISHDLAVVAAVASRILVMRDGRVLEHGPVEQVLGDPQHDYTRRLLAAVPSAASRGVRLSSTEATPTAERTPGERVVLAGRDLVRTYPTPGGGTRHALAGVDVELREGEVLGVVGESGSGKSTLARVLLGLVPADSGEVTRPEGRLDVQLVAQDPLSSFDPRYTVAEVVAEPLRSVGGTSRAGRRERVAELLAAVGLDAAFATRHPRTLSGGQRQRVAIARALAADPAVIVADEPVSALDVSIQAQVLDLLLDLAASRGLAILFISHDLGVVHHLADRIVVMKDGEVVEHGDVEQVFHHPSHPYTQRLLQALPDLRERAAV
ncbi:dipeptide ABC transporter ATP-binding protein [Serinibacter arcticus]|uniref:ABC transporter ATP-binding protein n=1 Tax=Serinibacter arcticus TaxID=1655435 RepID=A0A4Z1E3Z9_9MICO|nr:ABC transporter ATP-binding protein [Serinibacter arcticus]TGO06744.1 ABC transporter ATP-binding protein [Serinibacter arcticus]